MKEIVYSSKIMKKLFKTSKLNVEKIGNEFLNYIFILLLETKKIVLGHYQFGLLKVNLFS